MAIELVGNKQREPTSFADVWLHLGMAGGVTTSLGGGEGPKCRRVCTWCGQVSTFNYLANSPETWMGICPTDTYVQWTLL